eukprot:CAMPEP_0119335056 /NCGR_PEP_ID=MMETSP1333-20130426/88597_1 /TAXON_ID=418940 /ORGANISM="Scyphosphaera apsteinii, Strain RCC1455" /LENGTH=44 /DNA_ID= /DNA_START= /DNA_END= /DNA_ORIENTATION=
MALKQRATPHPRQLTVWLKNADSPGSLLELHAKHADSFNSIHMS